MVLSDNLLFEGGAESERFRRFAYADLGARDKVNAIRSGSGTPPLMTLIRCRLRRKSRRIVENLETTLERFGAGGERLGAGLEGVRAAVLLGLHQGRASAHG